VIALARATGVAMSVALAVVATVLAPVANAGAMRVGNYEVVTDRWNDHTWIWEVLHSCGAPDCGTKLVDPVVAPATTTLNVIAIPRPLKSQRFQQSAFYVDGEYTLTVDVPDGVRCIGYNLPSHDVYSWDGMTLAGTIESTYDAGCYGGPGGTGTYTFALQRS
jgi:hypothetical protein